MEAKNETNSDNGADDLVPADLKERYREFQLVGSGGMGRVISAVDTRLDKRVAIKVLPRTWDNDKAIMRFQLEAKAASKLKHPGVVQVMDFGYTESTGEPYLVMEHVVGEDLESLVDRNGPLPIARVIDIAIQVAAALEHAHGQGVVHRDLKPANLMIDKNNSVRILDFGLARILHSDDRLTSPGQAVGTLLYMSPEQLRGEETGERADVYSLGLVIIKLATGHAPYEDANVMQLVQHRLNEAPTALPHMDDASPTYIDLDEVVLQSIAVNPADRFANMTEFKNALLEIEPEPESEESETHAESGLHPVVESLKRIPIKWLIWPAAVALLIVMGIAVTAWFRNTVKIHEEEATEAPHLLPAATPAKDLEIPTGFRLDNDKANDYVIGSEKLNDDDLKRLIGTKVKKLSLQTNRTITREGIRTIAELPLITLSLRATTIGDESADDINKIKTLKSLDIRETNFTDKGIKRLILSKDLETLNIKYTENFTDSGLEHVVNSFPNLKTLTIGDTQVTARGIKLLKNLKKLKTLNVEDLPIDDRNFDDVLDLNCSSLNICGTNITDKSLLKVAQHNELTKIEIEHCPKLTTEAVSKLEAVRPGLVYRDLKSPKPASEALDFYKEFGE